MTESLNGIEIKPAESLKVGDNLVADVSYQRTDEIAEILPAEGNTPETYRLMGSYGFMTSDEVIYALSLEVPDEAYEESEYLGTETVSTPLGRVVCDVYLVSVLGMEGKLYVHNDILVNVQGERIGIQWTHSDFIVKKSMF